ncbi:autotransporter outer membrane beta-barrel domain-containing protein [Sphingomonas ginkgonis]|uniref:autotransporter outer membrane beta-barrel domain-containing protein n=1 Tax=Sphingomonas ginkgonis TaxID=2315330 RepID=UPI00163A2D63|nr:autotransporter outer membrane beta-barrel domain-containing protein [Sphingomonas ginkgonis]
MSVHHTLEVVLDRFCSHVDLSAISSRQKAEALREIADLRPLLSARYPALASPLARLEAELRRASTSPTGNRRAVRKLRRILRLLVPLSLGAASAGLIGAVPAFANYTPIPVGGTVFNPVTRADEKVVEIIGAGYAVRTDQDHIIFLATAVGDTYSVTSSTGVTTSYKVTAVSKTTYGTGQSAVTYVTGVTVEDSSKTSSTIPVVSSISYTVPAVGGADGTGVVFPAFPVPAGNEQFSDVRAGANGSKGSDGGGIRVCVPLTDICGIIGYGGSAGGNGATGPTFTSTVPATYSGGLISSTADNLPGIQIASIGGTGGQGGAAYGNFDAQPGGAAGNGGNVTGINYVDVSTSGKNSYGMWVFSQAGAGGAGGGAFILGSGGGGGGAASGGSATGQNYGSLTTQGVNATGLLVQSLGGAGGSGGSSYGIVGSAGSGSVGGNGGNVTAYNAGTILTRGTFANGVEAQSIGGNGGSSGDAGGIVAFGATAGGAGTGGNATITLDSTSDVTTAGNYAHGAFAQSVGGGGGSTGFIGGAVSFGGSAGIGGTGGQVNVNTIAGSSITTFGIGSYGIFAESVGGNGGTAAGTGGVFTMGGSGGSGNTGGNVTVASNGAITTYGTDSRGIFVQSVGGGGGNANTSGGVVSLGGTGGSGANGGTVKVTLGSSSDVSTATKGSDGVFAQSVGGGGGAGGTSGGLVALGGSGSVGGQGGQVSVSNAGVITTGGAYSRGIFAESVGGGGGSGGDGYGLAAIGGSGSAAGAGGNVSVDNSGSIATQKNMSAAMQAQSVGGGGGDGGTTGGVLLTIGGSGAGGGVGGTVISNMSGTLETHGNDSMGLFAQSVGGGGGNGGSSTSVSLFAGLALGGSGAGGGAGGVVTANFFERSLLVNGSPQLVLPSIVTSGDRSGGVLLQSIGGGGGNGGMAVQVSAGLFGAASFALGGSGGAGGTGGVVTANGKVAISTAGDNSSGFFAQSVGGGGGSGGASVAVAASVGVGASASLAVSLGGSGGSGGAGGTVNVNSGGSILTTGAYSTGFVAQSVGGGGGKGGFSVSVAGAGSSSIAIAGGLGIGGSGGKGGVGGNVTASFDGDIDTGGMDGQGHDSGGALIQSVGGGGGGGGFNVTAAVSLSGAAAGAAAVGLGGTGGDGGVGGTVIGSVGGNVVTHGVKSTGVLIQSAGGGGGSGGFNVSGTVSLGGAVSGGIQVGLGGAGGGGGNGGTVTGSALGTVQTFQAQSDGVVIQSVGGGGGSGGFNVSGGIALGGTGALAIGVGLGGNGGGAGSGGIVTGTVDDVVTTSDDQSRGIVIQSVGGGGGAGAFNVTGGLAVGGTAGGAIGVGLGGNAGGGGSADIVTATVRSVHTMGDDSTAFVAQSVGGGGGIGGFNVTGTLGIGGTGGGTASIGLGGSGGSGGSAKKVTASLTGVASSGGDRSGAILAQSIGGGGGAGSFNISAGIAAGGTGAGTLNIGLGGSGGTAGVGGDIDLTVAGYAITDGMESDGIVAQSVGGGGGNGGFTISGGIAAAGTGAGQVGFGLGGRGGGGGHSGDVSLTLNGGATTNDLDRAAAITTHAFSNGIIVQSLGGGGGNGGFNVTGGASFAGTGAGGVNIGIGGSGGAGGYAMAAKADISGYTRTSGDESVAILTQSIGGGGGNGGFSVTGGLTVAGTGSGTLNIGIGGAGGTGGKAGDATLKVNAGIVDPAQQLIAAVTGGDHSDAVVVQSLGGGGGNGGFNVTGGINIAGSGSGGGNIGIGGMGGDGGMAGNATADITGGIATSGFDSDGVIVQSIGGGGGNGGFDVSGTLSVARNSGALSVGVGGFGGNGGQAGDARLDLNQRTSDPLNTLAAVSTVEAEASGIIVQSLGGGGGNGGFNVTGSMSFAQGGAGNLGIGVGGFGGDGGLAGQATANVRGDLVTIGASSGALLVQSIGGGGGNGGFNVTAGLTGSKGANGNIGIGVGGFGGTGGDGQAVHAKVESDIQTSGAESFGATMQSLGGGGGNGGFNVTGGVALTIGQGANGNFGFGIGGFGGDGGDGGTVTIDLTGNIQTVGKKSYGILVQSQGGGGGGGGFNVTGSLSASKGSNGSMGVGIGGFGGLGGDGKLVTASMTGNILTQGNEAYGATFQSLGGGGGDGAFNVTAGISLALGSGTAGNLNIGIGGFGGGGGTAGDVIGSLFGNVQTHGADAHGILIQSLGGGGGNGGFNVSGGIALAKGTTGSVGFGLGGFGGDGGDGGIVTGTLAGNVNTSGPGSYGAMIESVGGAGGNGALNVTGGLTISKGDSTSGAVSIGIGGFGGGGGNAKAVTADVRGTYVAEGPLSPGVVALSLGGGGGAGGLNVSGSIAVSTAGTGAGVALGLGGFGGDGGNAGDVTLVRVGETVTRQSNSDGVVAASIGGGGGRGGLNVSGGIAATNTGNAGTVTIGIGGFGGGGGDSGIVNATIVDSVRALGSDGPTSFLPENSIIAGNDITFGAKTHLLNGSNGIVVESLGGGGGSGGMNISGGISLAKSDDQSTGSALVLGMGGFGGGGGDAEMVNATVGQPSGERIRVQGTGDTKSAVLVASVGGGGGDGAMNISGGITTDGSVVAGFGGAGGGGGLGRAVTASVNADLFASGYKSSGLTVQSVGGGGGTGGINISGGLKPLARSEPVITFGMGGDGGTGNSSGDVTVQQDGEVLVDGFNSHGVLVQSVAGGGGSGGMDIVADVNRSEGDSKIDGFAAGIGIGGTGGSGGSAGNVSLRSTGNVLVNTIVGVAADGSATLSASNEAGISTGVAAQSIGGGGGSGGFNIVGIFAPKGNPVSFSMGGSGGVGGDAGTVTVRRGYAETGAIDASLINTFGPGSVGLLAQSIGGGGGNAGTNFSFAKGSTKADQTGFGGQIVIGGDGATSGDGKAVGVDHVGSIQTNGIGSSGLVAQSIGKGGGNAALNVGVMLLGEDTKFRGDSTKTSTVNGFSMAIGGAAGDAGSAGDVTVNHNGTIVTQVALSNGLVAQSLAGGGGNVAFNAGALLGADNNLKISIGREGGKGGTAGKVIVNASGQILVSGDKSNGIVAQSVGGAGGMSGSISVSGQFRDGSGTSSTNNGAAVSIGLDGAAGGHSSTVTVTNAALITTNGESARGIVAQSIGGDGGIAGSARTTTTDQTDSVAVVVGGGGGAGAQSEKVTVSNNGTIITKGVTSDGILAQSVGGSGGVGGSASTIKPYTKGLSDKSATTIAVTVGGSGGDGSVAGDVEVRNDGIISTEADISFGIRAQSIGGGGGVGGATYNIETQLARDINTMNLLIGGGGGNGQLAGRVDVFNHGLIQTTGAGSIGISATSVGGGGGDAGSVSNSSTLINRNGGQTNALQILIGAGGGSGGKSGIVNVVNSPTGGIDSGTIITTGKAAHGIFAQSLGGGGGNGSSILDATISNGAKGSISVGVSLGGGGGDGNPGGDVTVANSGLIHTSGEGSFGILAQSIGGGGGNGGLTLSANLLLRSRDKSPLISLGGIGGNGNDGGHVTVSNSGEIITKGKNADGIVAQSIGGGGGSAGFAVALTGELKTLVASNLLGILVGSEGGGSSGLGGQVDVVHSGDITVLGEGSQAIVAESINGGGGHVSFEITGIAVPSLSGALPSGLVLPDLYSLNGLPNLVAGEPVNKPVDPVIVAARVGASDASKLNGGNVNITVTGTLGAAGDFAKGTTIRSVGGGGGALTISGSVVDADATIAGDVSAQAIYAVGLGAKDSNDSSGAALVSNHSGEIVTTGKAADGVLLQSIGGGGGSALVNLTTEDPALIDSVRLGLGAVNTSDSSGGAVTRTQTGAVVTTNDLAHGAVIQSIGGGGGEAIASVRRADQASPPVDASAVATGQHVQGWKQTLAVDNGAGTAGIVSLGATGGSGNDGAAVTLSFTGGFATLGDHANGLVVQSIGAGGGAVTLDGMGASSILLGGQANAAGSAGAVTVVNNGTVMTAGQGANGILLQSIGGGGGAVFNPGAGSTVTLSASNSGDGGTITLNQTGDLLVTGANATGILAQSLGGGGGYVEGLFAGTAGGSGRANATSLGVNGAVLATGLNSTAIVAQSVGSLGGGDITVSAAGAIRGGSGTGAGIALAGGANNVVTIQNSLSSVSGLALTGTFGNDRLENNGLTVGNIDLGSGNNLVHNAAGATFLTIDTLNLRSGAGSTGAFQNDGNLLLGLGASRYPLDLLHGATFAPPTITDPRNDLLNGTSVISTVALNGDFRQSATGVMNYDVAFGPYASDRINATGTAVVNGTANITLTWLENNNPLTLIAAAGGGTDLGLKPVDTLAIDYGILANSTGIQLTLTPNFGLPWLSANQRQIGHNLDSSVEVGGAAQIGRLLTLLGNLTAGQEQVYADIFRELGPEALLTPVIEQLDAARDFSSNVLDCDTRPTRAGLCLFGQVETHRLSRSRGSMDVAVDMPARLRFGGAAAIGGGWQIGAAVGVAREGELHADGGRFVGKDGRNFNAGIGVEKHFAGDDGVFGLALAAGSQRFPTTRYQDIFAPGFGDATIRTEYRGADAKLGYRFSAGTFFARPELELQGIRMSFKSFSEEGLQGTGARSVGSSRWYLSATPKVSAGLDTGPLKLFGTVGYQFANKGQIVAPLRLVGAPDASDPARIATAIDKQTMLLGLTAEAKAGDRATLQFGFTGLYGDHVTSKSANMKLIFRF